MLSIHKAVYTAVAYINSLRIWSNTPVSYLW